MSTLYLETSAVLAWLLGESEAKEVIDRVNKATTVVTSFLTLLETERALIRAERQDQFTAADGQRLRGMLSRSGSSWLMMEVTDEIRSRAAQVFPVEPVRTLDAIHLSTALQFIKAFPDLRVLSYDRRILANLPALGIY